MSIPTLKAVRDDLVVRAIDASGGDVAEAARLMGVGRSTLYKWLAENSSCNPEKGKA